jgi:tetratricopeptide (TPR) repeat protein
MNFNWMIRGRSFQSGFLGLLIFVSFGTGLLATISVAPAVERNREAISLLHQTSTASQNLNADGLRHLPVVHLRLFSAIMIVQNRYAEAKNTIEAIPIPQRNSLDWLRLATALAMTGEAEPALAYAENLEISTDALVAWGDANWNVVGGEDNPALAKLWFRIASARGDGSWTARRSLGRWWRWYDPSRAIPILESVKQEQPDDPLTHYLLGLAYRDLGNPTLGIHHLETAVHLAAYAFPNFCLDLSEMYTARSDPGDENKARRVIASCLEQFPENEKMRQFMSRLSN